ncbi:MAG: hypothetical protein WC848_04280 [Parcubacteria group bacterium]|jgi:hypothetical protein
MEKETKALSKLDLFFSGVVTRNESHELNQLDGTREAVRHVGKLLETASKRVLTKEEVSIGFDMLMKLKTLTS